MPKKHTRATSPSVPRFLLGLYKVSPKLTALFTLTQISFAILTTTIAPLFVSKLLLAITQGTATLDSSAGLLLLYGVTLFFGDVVMIRLSIYLAYTVENKMQVHVLKKVLGHLETRSIGYHSNRMTGGTVSDTTKLNGSIERFWDTLMFTAVPIATTILAVCTALAFLFWQYALILFVLSLIVIAVIVRAQSSIAPTSKLVSEKSSAATAYLADVVGNISVVKAFAREKDELAHFSTRLDDWLHTNRLEMRKVLLITGSFSVLMTIMNTAAFFIAIYATQFHLANVAVVYLIISYTLSVVSQLWAVSSATRNYIRILGDASPMISTLSEKIEITDPVRPLSDTISKGEIEFHGVNFTHEENNEPLFTDFSLTIPPGQRIGVVGHSGSGKTSLTRLLLRFSDLDAGTITIDGLNIAKLAQSDLHRSISYVPQEPLLFHRTLRENIAYGKPDATDEEVETAAHYARVDEFTAHLPKGYNTIVGERGVKLSGGQRQRIAIARAILKDAPILVLDEATSALDSESEKLIQESLDDLMRNRTSLVIAHRLSTIAKLDRIIVLGSGKIVEDGTHAALLAKNGVYAKLWKHQSGGFIEE